MPDPNDPPRIIDPRLGSLMVSAAGHRAAPPSEPRGAPLEFGPPAAAGEAGTLGPYRIVRELGRGGMGAVFLAVDARLDRQLALKVMLPEFAAAAEARERFLREARAAAKIGHDHVVTVFEADERDGIPYIAMQLLQGYPLDAFVQQKGTPSLRHVARIAREAALGLAAAHRHGVVHRDIKPANLWLEAPNGRVKLLDFGLARPDNMDTELTKSGVLIGTPAFMSPEQALGERVDHRTDLFSLGAVLYWLGTGRLPFSGASVVAVLKALGTAEPPPVLALNPRLPVPLAELIHQLLAKAPDGRPQTAAEVANRLHGILERSAALVPAGGSAPAGAPPGQPPPAGDADPWTTLARSPSAQHAGPAPPPPGEPKVLRSIRVVAITPTTRPAKPQRDEPPPPAGRMHTVISSGVVWDETRPNARAGVQEEEEEEKEKEEAADEAESPDRPRRRRARRRAPRKNGSGTPILIGAGLGAVVLVAAVVAVTLVADERPTAPKSPPSKTDDHTAGTPGRQEEPPTGGARSKEATRPGGPKPDAIGPATGTPEPAGAGTIGVPIDPLVAGLVGTWASPVEGLTEVWTVRCVDGKWEVSGVYLDGAKEVGSFVTSEVKLSGRTLTFVHKFVKMPPRVWGNNSTVEAKLVGDRITYTWYYGGSSGTRSLTRSMR